MQWLVGDSDVHEKRHFTSCDTQISRGKGKSMGKKNGIGEMRRGGTGGNHQEKNFEEWVALAS